MIEEASFAEYWHAHHGLLEPISHLLKSTYPKRWVRFHALPESKRYPESTDELQCIFARYNDILNSLTTTNSSLDLISLSTSESSQANKHELDYLSMLASAKHWHTLAKHEIDQESFPNFWHFYQSSYNWHSGIFDTLFEETAMGRMTNFIICNKDRQWLFAPYDGGVDIILKTSEERNQLKNQFHHWCSTHPDGL